MDRVEFELILHHHKYGCKIDNKNIERSWRLCGGIYFLVLFGLHLVRVRNNDFWSDEFFTINLSHMSLGDMFYATAMDVHPPLYYLLTWSLYHIFGDGNGVIYHLASLIPFGLLLIFIYFVMWKHLQKYAVLLFATFAAFSYWSMNFIIEARMYSMGMLFVSMSYCFLYLILEKDQKKYWIGFVLSSLGAAYTHYYALISVAFLYLFLFLFVLIWNKKSIKLFFGMCGITVLGYLPWFVVLLQTFGRVKDGYWIQSIPGWKTCLEYLFYPEKFLLWIGIILILIVIFYETGILNIAPAPSNVLTVTVKLPKFRHSTLLLWISAGILSIIGTIGVGIGVSVIFRPMFQEKYIFPVVSVAWMIFSVCISRLKYGKIWGCVGLAFLLFVLAPNYKMYRNFERNEAAQSEIFRNLPIQRTDEIISNSYDVDPLAWDYYYSGINRIHCDDLEGYLLEEGLEKLESVGKYWMILSAPMDLEIIEKLQTAGYNVAELGEGVFANSHVYGYCVE